VPGVTGERDCALRSEGCDVEIPMAVEPITEVTDRSKQASGSQPPGR